MREVTPTRTAALELADERRLMRQGYEFLDERRILLASEMVRQLRDYQRCMDQLVADTKDAGARCRRRSSGLQLYPAPAAPAMRASGRTLFLGLSMLSAGQFPTPAAARHAALDPSPEAKTCRAVFEQLLWAAADIGLRASNLTRLAREYRRTERRANALEKVLLPEVEQAIKLVDEQLDTMEREEVIRTRSSRPDADVGNGTGLQTPRRT